MQNLRRTFVASGLALLLSINAHSEGGEAEAGIRALMSAEQYRAAGLDRLSPEQREYLYRWLQQYAGKAAAPPSATSTAAQPAAVAAATPSAAPVQAAPEPAPPPGPAVRETAAPPPGNSTAAPPGDAGQPIVTAADENFGFPDPPVDHGEPANQLHATVLEPFRGWSGKTLFYLDNGQVWKQRSSGRHTYTGEDNRVVIYENRFGFFEMRLIAADRSIGVKRVK